MKTIALKNNQQTSDKRLFVLFVLLVLSSVGMFGQELKSNVAPMTFTATEQIAADGDSTSSQMELVSWFMGTKQSQVSNAGGASNTISTNSTGKKQFINAGMTTNRILSRTFLKKAISRDNTIA
jgi:hypothetical protein